MFPMVDAFSYSYESPGVKNSLQGFWGEVWQKPSSGHAPYLLPLGTTQASLVEAPLYGPKPYKILMFAHHKRTPSFGYPPSQWVQMIFMAA